MLANSIFSIRIYTTAIRENLLTVSNDRGFPSAIVDETPKVLPWTFSQTTRERTLRSCQFHDMQNVCGSLENRYIIRMGPELWH
jgi:hypothetical protein